MPYLNFLKFKAVTAITLLLRDSKVRDQEGKSDAREDKIDTEGSATVIFGYLCPLLLYVPACEEPKYLWKR